MQCTNTSCGLWSEWSGCSETCGNGTKTRNRTCAKPECHNTTESVTCNDRPCEERCDVSSWTEWTACNCSKSITEKTRTRIVTKVGESIDCKGFKLEENEQCDCNKTCEEPMVLSNCSSECPYKCDHIVGSVECVQSTCTKGCRCAEGYLLQDEECVKREECKCPFDMSFFSTTPVATTLIGGGTTPQGATTTPGQGGPTTTPGGPTTTPQGPGGLTTTPQGPGGPTTTPKGPGGPTTTPKGPGGPTTTPKGPGGPTTTPKGPGGPTTTPQGPGGPTTTPQGPGGPTTTPQGPGGPTTTPQGPGGPTTTPQGPGGPTTTPQGPGGPTTTPQGPGGPTTTPQGPGGPTTTPLTTTPQGPGGPTTTPPGPGGPTTTPQGPGGPTTTPQGPGGPTTTPQGPGGPTTTPQGPGGPTTTPPGPGGPTTTPQGPGGPTTTPQGPGGPTTTPQGPGGPTTTPGQGNTPPPNIPPNEWVVYDCKNCTCEPNVGMRCKDMNCTTPPEWRTWSPWSACSAKCGSSTRSRSRECQLGKNNPKQCDGLDKDTQPCTEQVCPCQLDPATIKEATGKDDLEQGTAWVEIDGEKGMTLGDRLLNKNDVIAEGVQIHMNCRICTCKDEKLYCDKKNCTECTWNTWTTWSTCTETCGGGNKTRTRTENKGSPPCEGPPSEVVGCNEDTCPTDGGWSTWTPWSECEKDCGGAIRKRSRECDNPVPNDKGKKCEGLKEEEGICNQPDCPENCTDLHTVWSNCSNDCTDDWSLTCGQMAGIAACVRPEACIPGCRCKKGFVKNDKGECTQECPCYVNGTVVQRNNETDFPERCEKCKCDMNGQYVCRKYTCDRDCTYSPWRDWGPCSVTCGTGKQDAKRDILTKPSGNCSKALTRYQECNNRDCVCKENGVIYNVAEKFQRPNESCNICMCNSDLDITCGLDPSKVVNGEMGPWDTWLQCSAKCGKGKKSRGRTCKEPECGGAPCQGNKTEEVVCELEKCPERCEWSWLSWSDCKPNCGNNSVRNRTITCECLTKPCDQCNCLDQTPPAPESEPCNDQKPCKQDCEVSSWSSWTACVYAVNCSDGQKTRQREITVPKVEDGEDCPKLEETERCPKTCDECLPPRLKDMCVNPCDKTCQHARQTAECTNNGTECVPDCRCPAGMYEHENGTCVPKNECGCEWDSTKFGPKPAGDPKYYPDGYVLSRVPDSCNNCTCVGYEWSCTVESCSIDCEWGDWEQEGVCSESCGNGIQKWKRDIKVNKKGSGSECVGNKTKEEKCKEKDCPCEDNAEFSEDTQCEDTCTDLLNNTYAKKSSNCTNKCKCKRSEGFYRQGDKCVSAATCEQCIVDGITYQNNEYLPKKPENPCEKYRCSRSKVVKEEDCNDNKRCEDNEIRVRMAGTTCCFECKPAPVCKAVSKEVNLRDFLSSLQLLKSVPCVINETQAIVIQECAGTCQFQKSASKLSWTVQGSKLTEFEGYIQDCSCCTPSYETTPTPIAFKCLDDSTNMLYMNKISNCECSKCLGPP
ncbi:SCO-spondin-like [Lineus longissimus]|uniref:SCO-spondin-like n=1 Tax=Lineus longissimus TaxID=88925 RepID=UPI00315D7D43